MGNTDDCWWDGTNPDTFFPLVYRLGDDSLEGHVHDVHLDTQARTIRECDMLEQVLTLPSESRILDTPCGYGRHSIELAARGHEVLGVDLCTKFINEAKNSAKRRALTKRCRFVHADMRSLPGGLGTFDVCINMFLSFGFFSDADNARVLRQLRIHLRPRGKLLIHSDVNPEGAYRGKFLDRQSRTLRDGGMLRIDESFDPGAGLLTGTWTVSQDEAVQSHSYQIRIYTHKEMIRMLRDAGFVDCQVLFPFNHGSAEHSQEVVYLARG